MDRKKYFVIIVIITCCILAIVYKMNYGKLYNNISINQDEWNSIINNKNKNSDMVISSIKFNGYNLLLDNSNYKMYYSLINENENKYNPRISYISNVKNAKLAVLQENLSEENISIEKEFKIMIYNDNEYNVYSLICTKFPLVNIEYVNDGNFMKNNINVKKSKIKFYLFDNLQYSTNRIIISDGDVKKNSDTKYIVNLVTLSPGKNVRPNDISIFNMKPQSRYVFQKVDITSNTDDLNNENIANNADNQNNINNKNGQGMEAPKNNYVELFENGKYIGLYSISGM